MQAILRLKRGHDRPRVHPWIFKGAVADVSDVLPGSAVTVIDAAGRFVGRGFFNPRPALCCRILTRVDEPLDREFFRRRLTAALAYRGERPASAAVRLVWSEADQLPGLVVDRYGPVVVVQCSTLAMAAVRGLVTEELGTLVGPVSVLAWDDAAAASLEGFGPAREWIGPAGPERVVVDEDGVRLEVSFATGHKTGLYLDQAENRRRIGRLAGAGAVLDAFAYTAGFACHALTAGAHRAVCIESSADAVAGARVNLALNGVAGRASLVRANVFDELRRLDRESAGFGLIVLDPPPFARSRDTVASAARGYKDINLRAMRLLEPGGRLATFSCSHHVSEALLADICRDAAVDAGVTLRVLASLTQAPDHPVLLTVPETRYLKGLLLERV